jgi:hypothetical protein
VLVFKGLMGEIRRGMGGSIPDIELLKKNVEYNVKITSMLKMLKINV